MILEPFAVVSQILISEKHAICLTPYHRKIESNRFIKKGGQ